MRRFRINKNTLSIDAPCENQADKSDRQTEILPPDLCTSYETRNNRDGKTTGHDESRRIQTVNDNGW